MALRPTDSAIAADYLEIGKGIGKPCSQGQDIESRETEIVGDSRDGVAVTDRVGTIPDGLKVTLVALHSEQEAVERGRGYLGLYEAFHLFQEYKVCLLA